MSENKLVKTITSATVVVGIASAFGYLGKKMLKENFISDPSASITNFGKWVVVLSGSLYTIEYLADKNIIPK